MDQKTSFDELRSKTLKKIGGTFPTKETVLEHSLVHAAGLARGIEEAVCLDNNNPAVILERTATMLCLLGILSEEVGLSASGQALIKGLAENSVHSNNLDESCLSSIAGYAGEAASSDIAFSRISVDYIAETIGCDVTPRFKQQCIYTFLEYLRGGYNRDKYGLRCDSNGGWYLALVKEIDE